MPEAKLTFDAATSNLFVLAIPDDQQLIKATTAEGVPFVLAQPNAKASQAIIEIVQRLTAQPGQAAAANPAASPH